MRVAGIDLGKHTLAVLNHCARVSRATTGASEGIVGLFGESSVANCAGRPVIVKSSAAVEAEAVQRAGLIAFFGEGRVDRAYGKSEGSIFGYRAGGSRYGDGILSSRSCRRGRYGQCRGAGWSTRCDGEGGVRPGRQTGNAERYRLDWSGNPCGSY